LPEGLSNSFWNELKTYEEEKKMTYVTSVEKIGFNRAQKEIALKMLEEQVPVETIARLTKLSIEQIQELQPQQK
jgi:hypothetical protein